MPSTHAHRLRQEPHTHELWPPSARGLKTAGLLIGGVWPVVLLAEQMSKNNVAWALLVVVGTILGALLAWHFPVPTGIVIVLAAIATSAIAFWAVRNGLGFLEGTPQPADYLRVAVLYPGPFLLAGALLLVASKDLRG